MSETSTPYTPASTSTTVAGNETVSLADEIKKYKTKELIDFLHKEEDLELSETAIKILEKEEVNGWNFLKVTEEKLRSYGMAGGPATRLADFAKECKEKKLRSFSSYKTKADLEKVLQEDYKISSGDITLIPQFKPVTCPVDESLSSALTISFAG
ncbi:hypothetical protein RclHR1_01840047 [Rhizophagus clarus]|uniref:SAM domain-containing protein n=1 Tax=Rhizophagus clarus TaxID=94130 RepID=A0A2Z6QZW0_9GLOM|nr:hypothetical protein RclHR1_12330007 [Rhizophagus clarus]GBB91250.1 hypothetical protein RclHR1_01840047 [Rhizophagus clarus]